MVRIHLAAALRVGRPLFAGAAPGEVGADVVGSHGWRSLDKRVDVSVTLRGQRRCVGAEGLGVGYQGGLTSIYI